MQHKLALAAVVQYGTARCAGWSGPGQGRLLHQYYQRLTPTPDPPTHYRPHPVQVGLAPRPSMPQKDRLARGKLLAVPEQWEPRSISPLAISDDVSACPLPSWCVPSSLIVRVVFLVPAADRNIGRALEAHVWLTAGRLACAWVQLRHCMFNWTLALARTEMHGVGSCRSSKDDFKQHHFLRLCSLLSFTRQQTTFQVCARKRK